MSLYKKADDLIPWCAAPFILFNIGLLFYFALYRYINVDEFEHLYSAWNVYRGEIPFKDFFEHHNLLFMYLLAPLFSYVEEGTAIIIVSRLFMLLFTLGTLYLVFLFAEKMYNSSVAWISCLSLTSISIYVDSCMEVRPDIPETFFGVASFYLLYKWTEKPRPIMLVFSGVLFFISFLFLQKALFFFPALLALIIIYVWEKPFMEKVKALAYFFSGMLPLLVLLGIYLLYFDVVKEYFALNFLLNLVLLGTVEQSATLEFPFYDTVFLQNTLVWTFGLLGIVSIFFQEGRKRFFLIVPFLLLAFFILFSQRPYRQYYMMLFPFLVIAASGLLTPLIKLFIEGKKPVVTISLISACFVVLSGQPVYSNLTNNLKYDNTFALKKTQFILDNTGEKDTVFLKRRRWNIYRKNIRESWFKKKDLPPILSSLGMKYDEMNDTTKIISFLPKVVHRREINPRLRGKLINVYGYTEYPYYDFLLFNEDNFLRMYANIK
ncbi:MAG: glycosyltransferase family 39 protein [Nitrospinae bacterium]|nr:glycosyltransferase family 39 protein [Nitrospinota bacterium]